jgi:uncharacterized protein (DUF427 family)
MTRGRVQIEHGRKRVRAYLRGELAADTTSPLLVWEVPYYPAYYIPAGDIRAELVPTGATDHSPSRGDAEVFDVRMPTATAPSAARRYASSPIAELRQAVRLDWDAMDEWLEEDEPVYTHPRDPYTRVDILASSRHVRVEVDGVTIRSFKNRIRSVTADVSVQGMTDGRRSECHRCVRSRKLVEVVIDVSGFSRGVIDVVGLPCQ